MAKKNVGYLDDVLKVMEASRKGEAFRTNFLVLLDLIF